MWHVAIIFLLTTLISVRAGAEAPSDLPHVAVSPFVYFPAASPVEPRAGGAALVAGMEAGVAADEAFTLVALEEVRRRVLAAPGYPQTVELARVRAELGVEKYRELDAAAAIANLTAAREQFARAEHDLIAPAEVSETLLFLALALLGGESTEVTGPLDVMRAMILVDPSRAVRAGAFPEEVVRFYEGARVELERDVRQRGPDPALPARIARLASRPGPTGASAHADFVFVGNVLEAPGGAVEVVVWLFDAQTGQFVPPASKVVAEPSGASLQAAATALVTGLLDGIAAPATQGPPIEPSSGAGPFALQLGLSYSSYLQFPDVAGQPVEPFAHVGAFIGANFFLTQEFALVGAFEFLSSRSEYSGLVEPGFTTLRTFLGGEIGVTWWRLRIALGTLAEVAAVSRITTCPALTVEARRACTPAQDLPARALFGVNARPRLSFQALRALQVYAAGSTSFYFLPLADDSPNYLTTFEAGLQYRF